MSSRISILVLSVAALVSGGCNTPDMAALEAQIGCGIDYDGVAAEDCRFGVRSARDFLVKDFAPFSRGVDASPSLVGRAANRTHEHCAAHATDEDACVDGVSRFAEAME